MAVRYRPRIVVMGSLNMDLVAAAPRLPAPGETIIGSTFLTVPGGKGANQAYAAARLGGDVVMLGLLGDDDHGRAMRANLASVGADISGIGTVEGASGVAIICVAETGANSITVVPGANAAYTPDRFAAQADLLAGAGHVLLQLETPFATVAACARAARAAGACVILDPAPAPDALPDELLELADILTPNESEAARLVDRPVTAFSRDRALADARALRARGARTIILKLGAQGCLLVDGETSEWIPAPCVEAIDTTAAGDTFNAALAIALGEGAALAEACRFAVRASALSVTRLGAQPSVPARAEVDAFEPAFAAAS